MVAFPDSKKRNANFWSSPQTDFNDPGGIRWSRCAIALAAREGCVRKAELLREAKRSSKWLMNTGRQYARALGVLTSAGIASVEGHRSSAIALLRVALVDFKEVGMRANEAFCEARLSGKPEEIEWFEQNEIAEPTRILDTLAPGKWD